MKLARLSCVQAIASTCVLTKHPACKQAASSVVCLAVMGALLGQTCGCRPLHVGECMFMCSLRVSVSISLQG